VILLLVGLSCVLSLVAAVASTLAAVWARSGAQALDGFAAITLPLLVRMKQKVDPDPMVATVVAAAAAAPPPAIVERVGPVAKPLAGVAPLPVIVTEDDDEPRESAPVVAPDEHSPTVPMAAPRSHAEPPETGPSRSGERVRDERDERAAGYFTAYVVPPEPPVSAMAPSSGMNEVADITDAAAERRRRAHELGQATERRRQLEARRKREAELVARQVGVLTEEEAARPSGEDFAMDRPSWEGRTAVHDNALLQAAMSPPPAGIPLGRLVPSAAAGGAAEAPPRAAELSRPQAPAPSPPDKSRARADSSPTLTSQGVVRGPRQRFDPRVEPEGRVEVTRPDHRR
jgi:hypothetical protein